jgi:hypothetical protein
VRVLFLVLDGLSPRHVDDDVMPVLSQLARDGGWSRKGGTGCLPSSTYPNHATFATGVSPDRHGIVANAVPTEDGSVPAWELGPSVPTLFDAMGAAGRPCAAAFGDHHLVGVTGARSASFLWSKDERVDGVARDLLGYARDEETVAGITEGIGTGAELVFAQMNEPDTIAHIFGPDSPEARSQYGRTNVHLGTVVELLREEWEDWAVIVVSDHSQETVTESVPIDLRAAARERGLEGSIVDDGAVAVAGGELAHDGQWMLEVPGIEGIRRVGGRAVLAWAAPGRYFSEAEVPVRGVHGSPRTAVQVAVVAGGHPAAAALGAAIVRRPPVAESWAPAVAELLGISMPPA